MLACSPTGVIYFLSMSYPGANNDTQIYKLPGSKFCCVGKCLENQVHQYLDIDEAIGADAGYKGLQHSHVAVLPFSDIKVSDPECARKHAFNNEFARYRTVVENVFSHVKN